MSPLIRAWKIGTDPGDPPVPWSLPLPLLNHVEDLEPTEWLKHLRIFGRDISAIIPGHFETYARVYHPFGILRPDGHQAPCPWSDAVPESLEPKVRLPDRECHVFSGQQTVSIGETYDIEFEPSVRGNFRIEVRPPSQGRLFARVPVRVE